jgi:dTDP-4-amino-4,6-dideoxygalactose transaminase
MKNKQKIIPFNSPKIFNLDQKKLKKLKHYSSNGIYTKKCSDWLKQNINTKEALIVNSCTAALEMCAILIDTKEGDEIIMPSYTFVSTANAFVLRGGRPIFVDIDKNTLNINSDQIEKAITRKTKAIVVVHYAGISADMDKISNIAKKNKLFLIEDCAQALLSKFKTKYLGSIGDLATISFHETKNIQCGQGGALLINNKKFIKKAKIIRDKGTNRDDFNNNLVKKYSWVGLGSSYAISEINAFILHAQLQIAKKITKNRVSKFMKYLNFLKLLEKRGLIQLPCIPKNVEINGHIFFIIILKKKRKDLIKYLKKNFISSVFHYVPLHSSKFGKKNGLSKNKMNITNKASKKLIRLPMFYQIKDNDIHKVCKTVSDFFLKKRI